ncbi:MAG: PepSY-associated TM helix domain-containing protein [Verrucomicrobiota bacterium]
MKEDSSKRGNGGRKRSKGKTKLFWKFHSWCGIYSGGFLAFVIITGAVAVFKNDIYIWENRKLAVVDATELDVSKLGEMIESACQAIPGKPDHFHMDVVALPADPKHALRVSVSNPEGFGNPFSIFNRPWLAYSIFIHPQSGEVLGVSDDERSIAGYLRSLHVRLFATTPGRYFVGFFGFTMLVSVAAGLVILSKFLGRKALWVIRNRTLRLIATDWHMLIGAVLSIPALMFAITGFWLGFQRPLMDAFSIKDPARFSREEVMAPSKDLAMKVDYVKALERVEAAYPGFIPRLIIPSSHGERTLKFRGDTRGMVYQEKSQTVVLDKADLSVLFVHNTHDSDAGAKLYFLQEGLHFGRFWGNWVQWVYLIGGLLIGLLPLSGYVIARLRRKESLAPVVRWVVFASVYSVLMLVIVRVFGIVVAMAYGFVMLALFLLVLLVWAVVRWWKKKHGGSPPLLLPFDPESYLASVGRHQ